MAKIDLGYNLGDVTRDENDIGVVPAGRYLFEITKTKFNPPDTMKGKAASSQIVAKILDAERDEQRRFENKSVSDFLHYSAGSSWRVAQFTDAIYGRKVEASQLDDEEFIGKRFVGQVMVEEYNGKERSRFERFYPPTDFRGNGSSTSSKPAAGKSVSDDEEVDI